MMLQLSPGPTGWALDLSKWAWGLLTGAISGGFGVLILAPAIASIDLQHFTPNIFEPGSNTVRLMAYIFAYGAIKNMIQYMAVNQIPTPFKDVHETTLEPTKRGGVHLKEESYQEELPEHKDKEKK